MADAGRKHPEPFLGLGVQVTILPIFQGTKRRVLCETQRKRVQKTAMFEGDCILELGLGDFQMKFKIESTVPVLAVQYTQMLPMTDVVLFASSNNCTTKRTRVYLVPSSWKIWIDNILLSLL